MVRPADRRKHAADTQGGKHVPHMPAPKRAAKKADTPLPDGDMILWLEDAREAFGDDFEISIHADGPIGRGLLLAVRTGGVSGSD